MQNGYIYQSDDIEDARLNELNRVYNPGSQVALVSFVHRGATVLERGSDIGYMGKWFSAQIGDKGLYCGVVNSIKQLDKAKKILSKLINIKLFQGNISNLSPLIQKEKLPCFDIIYCRWVLAHILHEAERAASLKVLSTLLKEEGYLIFEEADVSVTRCVKQNQTNEVVNTPALAKWLDLSKQLSATKLSRLFEISLDQKPRLVINSGPIFSRYEQKITLSYGLISAKEAFISVFHGCPTKESEVEQACQELEAIAKNDELSIHYFPNTIAIYRPRLARTQ